MQAQLQFMCVCVVSYVYVNSGGVGEEWGWFGTSRISPCVTMASRGLHLQMKKKEGEGGVRGEEISEWRMRELTQEGGGLTE